jgi:hypothetical protein
VFRSIVSRLPAPVRRVLPAVPLLLALLAAAPAMNVAAAASPQPTIAPPIGLTPVPTLTPVFRFVMVPDCHFLSQPNCESLLIANGLRLGTVTLLAPQTPPPYVGSHVVSQTPAPGVFVLRNSTINIAIQPFGPPFRP